MSGLANGLAQLFKAGRKRIGNAIDDFLVGGADARKAISDEVINRYKPKIELARRAESRRANNIKDLGDKVTQSKKDLADAQQKWQDDYANALAGAKNQRQADINAYDAQLKTYSDALASARAGRQSILDQLRDSEAHYNQYNTIFTDVNTGKPYIFDPIYGGYRSLDNLTKKERKKFLKNYGNFDNRLIDFSANPSGRVLNAFDESTKRLYKGKSSTFDNYYPNKISAQDAAALRNANNDISTARANLDAWRNQGRPADWDDNVDLKPFRDNYKKTNGAKPNEYSFNGQNYKDVKDLDNAYKAALAREQSRQDLYSKTASGYVSKRDKEIAQRIQDAKDIKKAKLALGAGAGIGALYAGAKAIYGGDDTDNTDNINNINNIDNTDNTYTSEPDSHFNVEKEGQAILKDRQQSDPDINVDTDFDPDKAAAVLASGAYDTGVEDGNSIRSSDDLGNLIGATTGGHTMEDRLYELIKAMKDPYKADAVANYIYSRHGDDPEVQNLGWRGWLNKYYGDSLRSIMNRDPSGYKGMHISGGL